MYELGLRLCFYIACSLWGELGLDRRAKLTTQIQIASNFRYLTLKNTDKINADVIQMQVDLVL